MRRLVPRYCLYESVGTSDMSTGRLSTPSPASSLGTLAFMSSFWQRVGVGLYGSYRGTAEWFMILPAFVSSLIIKKEIMML